LEDIQHKGFVIDGLRHISGTELLNVESENITILDVRPGYELSRLFDVKNIIYCPYQEVENRINELPGNIYLIVADAVGLRSKEVAKMLQGKGFKKVCHLAGGMVEWERDGLPVNTDRTKILTGSCLCQLKVRHKN
jgi:rhodanese-related sulfurtransferase